MQKIALYILSPLYLLLWNCTNPSPKVDLSCISLAEYSEQQESMFSSFSFYGKDAYMNGKSGSRASGAVKQRGAPNPHYVDGGSWWVNDLEYPKNVSGYGHGTFGPFNKPGLDSLWGKEIALKLTGNPQTNVRPLSGTFYLPQKIIASLTINGQVAPPQDYTPVLLNKNQKITIRWNPDTTNNRNLHLFLTYTAPKRPHLLNTEAFEEVETGKTWLVEGSEIDYSRKACIPDNGEYTFSSIWFEDLGPSQQFWIGLRRTNRKYLYHEPDTFRISAEFEATRNVKLVQ